MKMLGCGLTIRRAASIVALVLGIGFAINGLWIPLKAQVGEYLIERAWQQTLQQPGVPVKPWDWADTWPVAALEVGGAVQPVLASDSGQALAFAPGLAAGSVAPGEQGTLLISAHRDTHFHHLGQLSAGSQIRLQDRQGRWFRYRIIETMVVPADAQILQQSERALVILSTCYPLDDLSSQSSQRYLVVAELT